jgi:3-isopropylmalate/(R)-2-methylmalate dehydratase small subunit
MISRQLVGTAWRFEGLLDVDYDIFPWREGDRFETDEEYGTLCMTKRDPEFPQKMSAGDFIVGDVGFGYGHDHDCGARAIKGCGLGAVLCESSTPYFLRNAFNHGLLTLEIPGVFHNSATGDRFEVDLEEGTIVNETNGWSSTFVRLPDFVLEMLDAGNIYNRLNQDLAAAGTRA